jgi:CRISPR-associated protein Csb1
VDAESLYRDLELAVSLSGSRAVLRWSTTYQPAGGAGSKVFPPTYPVGNGQPPYVLEERYFDTGPRRNVLLDSVQSQANRMEEALLRAHRGRVIEVPLMVLEHAGEATATLTSLQLPHRYADAYLRDALLDGQPFDKSELGRSLLAASPDDATAIFRHDPGSLVFGAWNSHRKGRQYKFPRVYCSEVIGWDPVVGQRQAGRMDPMNLQGSHKSSGGAEVWTFVPVKGKGDNRLSKIGHGNIAPNAQHGGVTIASAQRMASLSLAGLDRIGFGPVSTQSAVAARAVLAAYAILADRLAFGGPMLLLRSGCELVMEAERLEWVVRGGGTEPVDISLDCAISLFDNARRRAGEHGIDLSVEPVRLTPTKQLAAAIDFSLTKAVPEGEEG